MSRACTGNFEQFIPLQIINHILSTPLQPLYICSSFSALFSLSIFAIAWKSKILPDASKAFVTTSVSTIMSAVAAGFLFYTTSILYPISADASTAPAYQALMAMEKADRAEKESKRPPLITGVSSEKALLLSRRIQALDGKMYGAYWCSHCNNQKKEFGSEACKSIQYIECDREGYNSENTLCKDKKVSAITLQ